ncbi:MAG: winged helix-turn-helix domain-containing protein [Promethearchaeia archaeon]
MDKLVKLTTDFLKLLSDPKKILILKFLKNEKHHSKEIQNLIDKSQSYTSQILNMMENANLIKVERKNNRNYYFVKDREIYTILEDIQRYVVQLEKRKLDFLNKVKFD